MNILDFLQSKLFGSIVITVAAIYFLATLGRAYKIFKEYGATSTEWTIWVVSIIVVIIVWFFNTLILWK